ncbi:hypothetical protein Tco_0505557, partial [Tanacetum coccineum]
PMIGSGSQAVTSYRTCPLPSDLSMIRAATCHHLSGATWRDTIPALSLKPPPDTGQRRSTVAVKGDRPPLTTVEPSPDPDQRWLIASQQAGQVGS